MDGNFELGGKSGVTRTTSWAKVIWILSRRFHWLTRFLSRLNMASVEVLKLLLLPLLLGFGGEAAADGSLRVNVNEFATTPPTNPDKALTLAPANVAASPAAIVVVAVETFRTYELGIGVTVILTSPLAVMMANGIPTLPPPKALGDEDDGAVREGLATAWVKP